MAETTDETLKGKLYFALEGNSEESLLATRRRLALDFSEIDNESSIMPAGGSASADQSGSGLHLRLWISTSLPVHLTELQDIKRFTGRLENSLALKNDGAVSVEPGYVTFSKVVRALGDDAGHRVMLSRGIYAEAVLRFDGAEGLRPWPWTPVDYQSPDAISFFLRTRSCFLTGNNLEP